MEKALNILQIEDSDMDAVLVLHELKKYWPKINVCSVEKLDDLEEALTRKWDIILCDFSLPELDGLTVLRLVRDHEIDTPFIVVSGKVEEDLAALMMRMGANDYVMKDNLRRLAPAIFRELKAAGQTAPAGTSPSMKEEKDEARNGRVISLGKNAFEGNPALSVSDFGKERRKAVTNILQAAYLIGKHRQKILEKEGISEPQLHVLTFLRRQLSKEVTLSMIREKVSDKKSDISRIIERMVKAGLVNYTINASDKRIRNISITRHGLDALAGIDKFSDQMFLNEALLNEEQSGQVNLGLKQMLLMMN